VHCRTISEVPTGTRNAPTMVSSASRKARNTLTGGIGMVATLMLPLPAGAQTLALPARAQTNVVTAWNIVASSVTDNWRAPTIAHLAIHDSLNAIKRQFEPYAVDESAPPDTSPEAAVSAAAHRVLIRLVPAAAAIIDAAYAQWLLAIPPGPRRDAGIALGERVATRLVDLRADDGFFVPKVYNPTPGTGIWRPTPPAFTPAATPEWATMRPFAMASPAQFRPDAPPALTEGRYAVDYDEVRLIGALNSRLRTADQTDAVKYWAGHTQPAYNRIARAALEVHALDTWEQARLFALLNMANSDASISTWDAKYTYGFWRPITAISDGDLDGNEKTVRDSLWQPFLNTPNHPEYAAGHSGSSGAAVRVLQLVFGTDAIPTISTGGSGVTRSFPNLSSIVDDVTTARIAAGAHFRFSCETAARMGRQIGEFTVHRYLRPVK
jgi:hypothetical protein